MKFSYTYFVYIFECSDGSYYTGVTNDIELRIQQHNNGIIPHCYTFKRRPVTLKYYQQFQDIKQAISWEKQLKGWNRRKKEALFIEDWNVVKKLASLRYGIVGNAWNDQNKSKNS